VMTVLIILGLGMANSVASCFLGQRAGTDTVFSPPSAFVILWPFLGFYLAGNVLREIPVTRRLAAWSGIAFILCWAAMAFGTGLTAPAEGKMNAYPHADVMLYDFLSVPRVAMSVAAWFILAYLFGQMDLKTSVQRFFKWAAPLTLGIYLVHPLFREVLWQNTNSFSWPDEYLAMPLMVLLIAAGSLVLTWLISLVPGLRRIVG
jgi:surface polysaccharide O-acyltransferase-like enzyme